MIKRCYAVVHKSRATGMIMHIHAVCNSKEEAQKCADNANVWYGEGHPMTPLVVYGNDVLVDPPAFPVEAFEKAFPK